MVLSTGLASTALAQASGGTVTTSGYYTIHTFTSGGTFTVNSSIAAADVVIVGGGGGGGHQHAGGGGAGGVLQLNGLSVANGTYTITIGNGGAGCTWYPFTGQDGGNSSALGYTAVGGGAGTGMPQYGNNGGSGGGDGYPSGGIQGGNGTAGQGYNGSRGNSSSQFNGGGGGGAGGAGSGANGGAALSTWAGTFAGGGGGGFAGGPGGGAGAGNGGYGAAVGSNAAPNTGSGGGGGGNMDAFGGNGGSGIVIIRYLTVQSSPVAYGRWESIFNFNPVAKGNFVTVSGWAADTQSGVSGLVANVYVDGNFMTQVPMGGSRPDVASAYGRSDFTNSGFSASFSTASLSQGYHYIDIWLGGGPGGWNHFTTSIYDGNTINVTAPLAYGTWESILPTSVNQGDTVTVTGWAADSLAGVSGLVANVYVDGGFKAQVPMGGARPDVANYFGRADFTNCGYSASFSTAGLSLGNHSIDIWLGGGPGGWNHQTTSILNGSTFTVNSVSDVVIYTATSPDLYHLSGTVEKAGTPASFGDGVILEVFKSSGTVDTVLWSSMLVRPNPNDKGLVNLTAQLATNDTLRYRLVSHTSDTSYDSVVFAPTVKVADIFPVPLGGLVPNLDAAGTTVSSGYKTAAIQNLLNVAKTYTASHDRVVIELPAGTYYLDATGAGSGEALLALNGTKNITLRGQGAGAKLKIVTVTPLMFLAVDGSQNIEFENIEFDYNNDCLPFIQGIVGNANGNTVAVNLSWTPAAAGNFRFVDQLFCWKFDQVTPTHVADSFEISNCAISGNIATLTLSPGSLATNDRVVLATRNITARLQESALRFRNTTDCTLRDVTLRAGGWVGFYGNSNNGLHFERYKVDIADSSRFMTTNGDGMRLVGSRRGPTVNNCKFEGMLDDGINIHAGSGTATNVSGSSNFTYANVEIAPNDVLMFYNDSGVPANSFQTNVVATSTNPTTGTGSVSPATINNAYNRVINLSRSGEGFIIRTTTFGAFRGLGIREQTGFGLIKNNIFTGTSYSPIALESNLPGEGPYPWNVVIQNNDFSGSAYHPAYGGVAIRRYSQNDLYPAPWFTGIQISGNTVGAGMTLQNW